MALTITDDRTILSETDATTGWSAGAINTADPDPVELTGCLALGVSTTTSRAYYTVSATNFTAGNSPGPSLIYLWYTHRAALDSVALGGIGMYIGDGTNDIVFHLAGKDKAVFRHDDGPSLWQCLLLDTASLPTTYTVVSGSYASLNWAAITRIGIQFKTLAKAIGGATNCFWDILRQGAIGQGLTMTGAASGAEGTFQEIATADLDTTNQKAFGIIRKLSTGVFGVQGALTFGSTTAGVNTYFKDADATVVFEARGIGNDKYRITVLGNASSGVTDFRLTDCVIKSATPYVTCSFSSTGIDVLTLTRCSFLSLGNAITFSTASADTANHNITGCKFDVCGQIDPGLVTFTGNTISRTTNANGGLLIDADGTANMSSLSFTSAGTGHAIYITAAGTYTLTNFTYSGYASTNGSTGNEVVYNNSGGAVTLNISGGNTPTVRNGTSASTTVVSSVNVTIHVQDAAQTAIQNARVYVTRNSDQSIIINGVLTDTQGDATGTTVSGAGAITIRVRKSSGGTTRYYPVEVSGTVGGNNLSVIVTLTQDTVASA